MSGGKNESNSKHMEPQGSEGDGEGTRATASTVKRDELCSQSELEQQQAHGTTEDEGTRATASTRRWRE